MIKIAREEFSEALFAELLPLTQKCWQENTETKGANCAFVGQREFTIEPNIDFYRQLAERQNLVLLMVREGTTLIGYAVGYTYYSPHHGKILCGHGDSIYVEPEYRAHTAVALLKQLERELVRMGAVAMGWPVSQSGPLYELLCKLGFVGDDIIMEKILCA